MPYVLSTPVDLTVRSVASQVRIDRLLYDGRRNVLAVVLDLRDEAGVTVRHQHLEINVEDPGLFARVQTMQALKDLRAVVYAHAKHAGLFGDGAEI